MKEFGPYTVQVKPNQRIFEVPPTLLLVCVNAKKVSKKGKGNRGNPKFI